MNSNSEIIEKIKAFTKKADELEIRAFNEQSYRDNGFVEEFNALFDTYCYGKQNRTVSGLNFGEPPRYDNLKFSTEISIEILSKTKQQITFWTEPKWRTLRFILDKRNNEYRIIRYETYLGEELWGKHKL